MIKKTIFLSRPFHLSVQLNQLMLKDKDSNEVFQRPMEDIGFLILENPLITMSMNVTQLAAKHNVALVFCNDTYHPSSMLLHLDTNHIQSRLFQHQISASEPLKKRLWQQTIQAKIKNQAAMLDYSGKSDQALKRIAESVKSGDTSNEEGKAAKRYWSDLFGMEFRRDRWGKQSNPALNYAYAVLRAAVARALSGSGLLPTLGIHHHNKYNAFCLADDIMEPYRPYVDYIVYNMEAQGMETNMLGKDEKQQLLTVLSMDILIDGRMRPLMLGLSQTTASLAACFAGEKKQIVYPKFHY